jgi:antirestriction protein ArdC
MTTSISTPNHSGSSPEPREAHQRADRRADVYARVTDTLIEQLEKGVLPWVKPWSAGKPAGQPVRHNGVAYRGINTLLLWLSALDHGFSASTWMTFKQAVELGGMVRKGEKGSLVVFAKTYTKTSTNDAGEDIESDIPFMKGYTVFNTEQIEGLPERYAVPPGNPERSTITPDASAEAFFARTGADIRHGGRRAFYQPSADFVQLPEIQAFESAEAYSATKGHELVHWTGHERRIPRTFGTRFGEADYAFEELIAEIGSAFLCADLGITPVVRPDHAAYLACWLAVLKADKRAIFTAASHAQRAVDYLHTPADPVAPNQAVHGCKHG